MRTTYTQDQRVQDWVVQEALSVQVRQRTDDIFPTALVPTDHGLWPAYDTVEPEDMHKQCWVVFVKYVEDDKSFLKLGEWKVSPSLIHCLDVWTDDGTAGLGDHFFRGQR